LSTNFLIVAPNVIVYQRLEKDFASNRIFHELPLVPPEWGSWNQKVILRGESAEPDSSENLFLTNVHQLRESRSEGWTPANAVEALLGQTPKDIATNQRPMLERIRGLKDLVVINDEAHHVHDEDLAWSQSLLSLHEALPKGLSLWLDFSATPKDQNGMYYPWTICDYPLAQAVEDRIVKAPIVVTREDDPKQPTKDPDNITKDNIAEKFAYWIHASVLRWKEHYKTYKQLGPKPVLFIMVEKNVYADTLGEYLWQTKEFGLKESEVLVIHTDEKGEITKKDLEQARQAARDIDLPGNKVKAIVSVMMLREGWDVRGVTVVLGLRPFSAKARILPEQVIGRGLRLMTGIGPDRTQTLEVLGTQKLLDEVREQLEAEGVGVGTTKKGVVPPIIIAPLEGRLKYDIAIPITKPRLVHNVKKLSELDPEKFDPIYDQAELDAEFRMKLKMDFAVTDTEVHHANMAVGTIPLAQELLSSITNKVIQRAKLTTAFSELYPLVRTYVGKRCFGRKVDLDKEAIRSHLQRLEIQEGIAKYLARKISELTVEKRALEFENRAFKLSKTRPFSWRRDLQNGPCECKTTLFNYVATYNGFERRFAKFLEGAEDVLRFASLGTTEQGDSATKFRVDYLKPSGAIGFYHPDWVVVQKVKGGEANWIVETKGREWEGTDAKDDAITDWCQRISKQTGQIWRFARVNQAPFDAGKPQTLAEAVTDKPSRPAEFAMGPPAA
jgi:type III restriction enzyme